MQYLRITTPFQKILIIGGRKVHTGSKIISGLTGKCGPVLKNQAGDKLLTTCQEFSIFVTNTFFQ